MTTTIEFLKSYSRKSNSRSPWDDSSRVAMLWHPETYSGVYLHLALSGDINGFSVSKAFQEKLPSTLKCQQYISSNFLDIVMHIFGEDMEAYCSDFVSEKEFKEVFLICKDSFFSDLSKAYWNKAYNNFLKNK